jgi:hypothetical protein
MHDLKWSSSGDFVLDEVELDLKDTRDENYRGAIQRVQARLQSSKGDWQGSPQTGAGLKKYAGLPNTPEVGRDLQNAISNELMRGSLLSPQEVRVDVFPISRTSIATLVHIAPLGQRETITLINSYDLADNKVSPRN